MTRLSSNGSICFRHIAAASLLRCFGGVLKLSGVGCCGPLRLCRSLRNVPLRICALVLFILITSVKSLTKKGQILTRKKLNPPRLLRSRGDKFYHTPGSTISSATPLEAPQKRLAEAITTEVSLGNVAGSLEYHCSLKLQQGNGLPCPRYAGSRRQSRRSQSSL